MTQTAVRTYLYGWFVLDAGRPEDKGATRTNAGPPVTPRECEAPGPVVRND